MVTGNCQLSSLDRSTFWCVAHRWSIALGNGWRRRTLQLYHSGASLIDGRSLFGTVGGEAPYNRLSFVRRAVRHHRAL
ncbi:MULTISPECIES: hypothetical protein [unclassified Microcoleus]|uniref:hypothetical protein n=1 Tax=unclassified Microcoleus TaxID=2642155 RepID=UPI0025F39D21|nr:MULTISPECIES: hypothetical protein [unclassified Microcoleus]